MIRYIYTLLPEKHTNLGKVVRVTSIGHHHHHHRSDVGGRLDSFGQNGPVFATDKCLPTSVPWQKDLCLMRTSAVTHILVPSNPC